MTSGEKTAGYPLAKRVKSSPETPAGRRPDKQGMSRPPAGKRPEPAASALDPDLACDRFDLYQPSGEYNRLALVGLPLSVALTGAALAWVSAWFNYSGYIVWGARLFASLMIWSLLTAWLASKAVKLLKVRAPGAAFRLSALGALLAWAAAWPAIHYFSGSSLGLAEFIVRRFEGGLVVNIEPDGFSGGFGGPDYRLFQGWRLAAFWLMEAVFYCLLAGKAACSQARRPFSEKSGRWYAQINLAPFKLEPADLEILARLPKCEVPAYLTDMKSFIKGKAPQAFFGRWAKITLFQDPDWLRPFIDVRLPLGRRSRYKLRHYRITLEESDILTDKFQATGRD